MNGDRGRITASVSKSNAQFANVTVYQNSLSLALGSIQSKFTFNKKRVTLLKTGEMIVRNDLQSTAYPRRQYRVTKVAITCTLLLSSPQLDNWQLRCWNITFYCMFEWINWIGFQLIDYSPLCSRRRYFSAKYIAFYLILGVRWVLITGLGLLLVHVIFKIWLKKFINSC